MGFLSSFFSGKNTVPTPEEIEKQNKKNFEVLKFDGLRSMRMGRFTYALSCFQEALKIENDFEVKGYMAQCLVQDNQLNEAAMLLEQMITEEPTHNPTKLMLCGVYYMQENYQAMAGTAKQALENNKSASAYYMLAKAEKGMGDKLNCVAHLTQAIAMDETLNDAKLSRAEVLYEMAQLADALKDVDSAIAADPENETALQLKGKILATQGDVEEAEKLFRNLIEQYPLSEEAYIALSQLFCAQKRYDEALAVCNDFLEMSPEAGALYKERGQVKYLKGDKDGAEADAKQAEKLGEDLLRYANGEYKNYVRETNAIGLFE